MARIVYAWELGGGFGHIHAFLAIARRLQECGHEVVFIVRDLLYSERELNGAGFRTLQAPLWQAKLLGLPEPTTSFSEILLHYGFLAEEHLAGLVRAWLELYRLVQADLVIGDYSPAALLAARIARVPAATFGTGFCRPPPIDPLPNLRSWAPVETERLWQADRKVLDTANKTLFRFGHPPLRSVAEIFSMQEDFLCTHAELDHYPERPGGNYWGAVYNLEQGVDMVWRGREKYRIFCYLKPGFTGLQKLLGKLGILKRHEIIVFCPGLAPAIVEKHSSAKLMISPHPVKLKNLTTGCDLAICLAGHGTVSGMLQAGIPLLLLPGNLEQYLTSRRVVQMGAGIMVADHEDPPDYLEAIGHVLNTPGYGRAACDFAEKYRDLTQECIRARIQARIMELVRLNSA